MAGVMQTSEMLRVSSQEELARTVSIYVSQGFGIYAQSPTSATLIKNKQLNVVALITGLLLCTIPGLIYLGYYSLILKDHVLEIRLVPAAEPPPTPALAGPPPDVPRTPGAGVVPPQLSPDGTHWWDGTQWKRLSS